MGFYAVCVFLLCVGRRVFDKSCAFAMSVLVQHVGGLLKVVSGGVFGADETLIRVDMSLSFVATDCDCSIFCCLCYFAFSRRLSDCL